MVVTKLDALRLALDAYEKANADFDRAYAAEPFMGGGWEQLAKPGKEALQALLKAARALCPSRFTVMLTGLSKDTKPDYPASIPWSVVAPHAQQAMRNHSQTLERLNERGGCSPVEIYCIVHHLNWGDRVDNNQAFQWIKSVADAEKEMDHDA